MVDRVRGLVGGLGEQPFVARQAEVEPAAPGDVLLLPDVPSHVADEECPGIPARGERRAAPGADREPERVAKAVAPDPGADRARNPVPVGIARVAVAVRGIEAQDLAREAPDPLRAERADVLDGIGLPRAELDRVW